MIFIRAVLPFFIVCLCTSNRQLTAAYRNFYWREWNGTIPYDAVPGGFMNGHETYIGSSYFPDNNGIIVTTITKDSKDASGHLGPYFLTTSTRTTILCAPEDSRPVWRTIQLDSMFAQDCQFIKGGYFEGTDLYIGRKQVGSNIFVGQVFPVAHKYQGFEFWNSGHVGAIKDFEALAYCGSLIPPTNIAQRVPVHCLTCVDD